MANGVIFVKRTVQKTARTHVTDTLVIVLSALMVGGALTVKTFATIQTVFHAGQKVVSAQRARLVHGENTVKSLVN